MNNKQRLVFLFGVLVTTLMVLFPPWQWSSYSSTILPKEQLEEIPIKDTLLTFKVGYKFIATPPSTGGVEIDLQRLMIQFGALLLITGTLFFIVKTSPENEESKDEQKQ